MAGKLAVYIHVDGKQYGPDDEVSSEVAEKITNPDAWATAPEPTSAPEPYDGVTIPDLKAEIAKRNEGRPEAEQIPSTGNRPDLVAALVADDQK